MEVTGVEGEQLAAGDGVAERELVGAGGKGLHAYAEDLAFDGVEVVLLVDLFGGEDLVEGFHQAGAGGEAVQKAVRHAAQHLRREGEEGDGLVDPVQELRAEHLL